MNQVSRGTLQTLICLKSPTNPLCSNLRHRPNSLVEITKTVPLEKLVWAPKKDPDNEIKTIHNRTEDPHPSGC